ncbi:MAG: hypothetical protein RLP44_02350 [Aggregatilineales bacterium]
MSDHSISVIDKLMKNVVARLLYLREYAEGDDGLLEQIDAAIQESSTVSHKYEVEVARMVNLVDEVRGQRDMALDELEVAGVGMTNLERMVDDLAISLEDLRDKARDPEQVIASRIRWQTDLTPERARILLDVLTGDVDVYLSHYTLDDLMAQIDVVIEEVEEARIEMEADGGVAE